MKPNRLYTVMIIPHSEKEPVTLRIPMFLIQFIFALLFISFFLLIIGVLQYMDAKREVKQLQYDSIQADTMKKEFATVSQDVVALQKLLNEMRSMEANIRKQANLDEGTNSAGDSSLTSLSDKPNRSDKPNKITTLSIQESKRTLNELKKETPEQYKKFENLLGQIQAKNEKIAHTPSIYPTFGRVTSKFGYRRDPMNRRTAFHRGYDIANRANTPIYATANGVVILARYNGGYGRQVKIDHGNGLITTYSHMRRLAVEAGQEVEKGQVVGYMGTTGKSTGNHLHYEVLLNGANVNPADYFPY